MCTNDMTYKRVFLICGFLIAFLKTCYTTPPLFIPVPHPPLFHPFSVLLFLTIPLPLLSPSSSFLHTRPFLYILAHPSTFSCFLLSPSPFPLISLVPFFPFFVLPLLPSLFSLLFSPLFSSPFPFSPPFPPSSFPLFSPPPSPPSRAISPARWDDFFPRYLHKRREGGRGKPTLKQMGEERGGRERRGRREYV